MHDAVIFDGNGSISGVRVSWTYDRETSVTALRSSGLNESAPHLGRDQLDPLARATVNSLRASDFYTFARVNGTKQPFDGASDSWLEWDGSVLTLHMALNFKQPVSNSNFTLELFDETDEIEFDFQEGDAVIMTKAPKDCALVVARPGDAAAQRELLGDAYLNPNVQPVGWDAQYSNKVSVRCLS